MMSIEYICRAIWRKQTRAIGSKRRARALRKLGYTIGNGVYVGPGLTIAVGIMDKIDGLEIGDRVSIGPNVTLLLSSHPNNSRLNAIMNKSWGDGRTIRIGHDSWLGANAVLMPGVTIGRYSVVAAGAVVTHDVPDYSVVAGVPARVIKTIDKSQFPDD